MADIDYVQYQRQYGGRCIARRDGEIIASAETSDALSDHPDGLRDAKGHEPGAAPERARKPSSTGLTLNHYLAARGELTRRVH